MAGLTAARAGTTFQHHASIYGSDDEFLDTALPFVQDGLGQGDPVLVATTAANLDLLSNALGAAADRVDYAESAYFGRRPAQRVTAFGRYWKRHAASGADGHVRILAEPIWAGRPDREVTEWRRMESGLNDVLACTNIWMICPYDARTVNEDILTEARRTHPGCVSGRRIQASPEYVEPGVYARGCDSAPLPEPPPDAARMDFGRELAGLRRFVAHQAAEHGLTGHRISLLVAAVNEVASHVVELGCGHGTVRIWARRRSIVCDVREPAGSITDPFLGYRLPTLDVKPGDRFWLARQVCEFVEIRSGEQGSTIRLHVPGPPGEELQAGAGRPA